MPPQPIIVDIVLILPEIFLVCMALGLLLWGAFQQKQRVSVAGINITAAHRALNITSLGSGVALLFALVILAYTLANNLGFGASFGGMLIHDTFSVVMKTAILLAAFAAVVMSYRYTMAEEHKVFEYYILLLLAVTGMLLMVSANDFLALYIGLELQSLALYVLAAIRRDSAKSTEAGLKYFLLGALSSGLLLYGISLIYGFTGATNFEDIEVILRGNVGETHLTLIIGMVFILCGIAFKISAVPFHMWTPDVYQGAPTSVTAFFAVAPKLAAFAILLRLLAVPFISLFDQWQQIVLVLSVASMIWGAFAGLRQENLKRLMAYSSIGHMGYALIGISAVTMEGVSSVIFYLLVYAIMTIGAFACILSFRKQGRYVDSIEDLSGLVKTNPGLAYAFGMILISMAGIPVFGGFMAKLYVFEAAVGAGLYIPAVIGALASVVAAYYYLRVCKVMFFDEPIEGMDAVPDRGIVILITSSAILSLILLAWPAPQLMEISRIAAMHLVAGMP